MKLAVIFGGVSSEHNVSIVSATNVIVNLDKRKYDIYPIYISKEGNFYKYDKNINEIKILKVDDNINDLIEIPNIFDYLKDIDVIFPVLHGVNGEDGTIQGLFELIGKPYVGCKVLSSSVCMDKVYTKILLESKGIKTSKYMYIKKYQDKYIYFDKKFNRHILTKEELINKVIKYLKLPIFIKPSREGSSVGVNKVMKKDEIIKGLENAFKYDDKVLIEKAINGREVECAVLGNKELLVSNVGEVLSAEEYYTYNSKYKNSDSKTIIPADINGEIIKKIQEIAKKAFYVCDCSGLSRIDFFVEKDTDKIILNEINTMPGFTSISMYPKLMEQVGLNYSNLLDNLIELARK